MALVKNLINQAFAQIGSISDDEEADGTDGALGVQILNQIINQANVEQLFPFMNTVTSFTVTTLKNEYTIGDLGDISADRPEYISRILSASSSGASLCPVRQMDLADLLQYVSPSSSGSPSFFAYNAEYPEGKIYFDKSPSVGSILTMVYTKGFPVVTIDTDLTTVPPKYDAFIVASLSRLLAVHKKRPAEIVANMDKLYQGSKQYILNSNARSQVPTMSIIGMYPNARRSFLEGTRY
jgi:hypothetical protein